MVIEALDDKDRHFQSWAAREVGEIGNIRAVEPLIKVLLGDRDRNVRNIAAEALFKIGEVDPEPLKKFLGNEKWEELQSKIATRRLYAEAAANLGGIHTCQEAYKLANGTYINCSASPRATPDQNAVPWVDTDGATGGFTAIVFQPRGAVRFVYAVQATETSVVIEALGDTDGDGNRILFIATNTTSPHVLGPGDAKLTLTLGTHNDTKD